MYRENETKHMKEKKDECNLRNSIRNLFFYLVMMQLC